MGTISTKEMLSRAIVENQEDKIREMLKVRIKRIIMSKEKA